VNMQFHSSDSISHATNTNKCLNQLKPVINLPEGRKKVIFFVALILWRNP
jgi:hypothetical protein